MFVVKFRFAIDCPMRVLRFENQWTARQVWEKLRQWGAIMCSEKP